MNNAARTAPAVARNREAILAVMRAHLPQAGTVLEIASGSGEHALFLADALPGLKWQPTDRDPEALSSIEAWREAAGPANLLPPLLLDAALPDAWPVQRAEAVVCINMIHIAPWPAAEGLLDGAGRVLPPGGLLYLYGPFIDGTVPTSQSNLAFDADLRARNPAWGLRDLDAVVARAGRHGLVLTQRVAMPANNLSLLFTAGL